MMSSSFLPIFSAFEVKQENFHMWKFSWLCLFG